MGFRVGQKVRIVKHYSGHIEFGRDLLQKTGVIETNFSHLDTTYPYGVKLDARLSVVYFAADELAPVDDDNAETRFLQAMRDYANKQRTPVDVLRELHGEYL
jgi:hypothetical protein